jgi:hypothetical protein
MIIFIKKKMKVITNKNIILQLKSMIVLNRLLDHNDINNFIFFYYQLKIVFIIRI